MIDHPKGTLHDLFLVYCTYLFHLWKFICLAYALKNLKKNSIYWCKSLHMYVRLSIGITQIIYYNKYWHKIVLINVQFFSISIKVCKCMHPASRRCNEVWGRGRGLAAAAGAAHYQDHWWYGQKYWVLKKAIKRKHINILSNLLPLDKW